jgi:hypothetical protein
MGQLDRAALLMSTDSLHIALGNASPTLPAGLTNRQKLKPYQIAEIEECSNAHDEAVESGYGDFPETQCQWFE